MIRWFTRSEWSHTFLVVGDFHGTALVLEAANDGVALHRFAELLERPGRVELWAPAGENKRPERIEAGVRAAMAPLGQPYPWRQVAGMALVIAARRVAGAELRNPFRRWDVCSELLLRYLREDDPEGPWRWLDKDATSPEMIHADVAGRSGGSWVKVL